MFVIPSVLRQAAARKIAAAFPGKVMEEEEHEDLMDAVLSYYDMHDVLPIIEWIQDPNRCLQPE